MTKITMNFIGSLIIGLAVYSVLIFLLPIDWLSALVTLGIFLLLRKRMNFNARGYWIGELISFLAFDITGLYILATMQLPFFTDNPAYAIGQMIPGLLVSLGALIFFGRNTTNSRVYSPPNVNK
jgi:hypothetical protein